MPFLAAIPLSTALIGSAAIGAGASVAGSVLSNRPKTSTSSSSSTTTPTFTPETQALMDRLIAYSDRSMNNPMEGFSPIRDQAYGQVNLNYRNVGRRLASQFASRGYGSSGSFGNSLYDTELARAGDLSKIEGDLADKAISQQNFGATLGEQLVNFGRGSTSEGTGTNTQPGNMAGAGLQSAGNGLENLSTLLMLTKVLKP